MKKNYDTRLLLIGILLILTQITSFTLQDYFGTSHLTLAIGIDIIIILLIAFFLIAQFKQVHLVTSIMILVYAGLNLVYSFSARLTTSYLFTDRNLSVFFGLSLMLAYSLFTIAAIFLVIHTTQKRFESTFTFKVVGASTLSALILLGVGAFILPVFDYTDIVVRIFTLVSLTTLFLTMLLLVKSESLTTPHTIDKTKEKARAQFEKLYADGLISEAEYKQKIKE